MPKLSDVSHVIAVRDLDAASDFYRGILGFEEEDRGAPGWKWFVKDVCTIMAGHCPDEVPALDTNNHSYILHVKIDDVDTYHDAVKGAGGDISNELGDRPWGFREFTVRSNEGHRITFAQRLAD